jgi:hypothetical protein
MAGYMCLTGPGKKESRGRQAFFGHKSYLCFEITNQHKDEKYQDFNNGHHCLQPCHGMHETENLIGFGSESAAAQGAG